MRQGSDDLRQVLAGGGFLKWFTADLYYANERRLRNVPLFDVQIDWDGDGSIQGSMSCKVASTPDFSESLSPREIGDVFAPFGPELAVVAHVSVGRVEYQVPVGWFRLVDVPSAADQFTDFAGRQLIVSTVLELQLKDRFYLVEQNPFDNPSAAQSLTSVYDEFARITGLPITRTIPDGAITRAVAYEDNRLDAAYELVDVLDAVPHMLSDGTTTFRPNEWPDPVDTVRYGDGGTLLSAPTGMTSKGVYNRVVFNGEDDAGSPIYAFAEILDGPLRVREPDGSPGPAGVITRRLASDYVNTQEQAQAYVDREVERTARIASREIEVTETFNPLREIGDVLWLETQSERLLVRVTGMSLGANYETKLKVVVGSG
jgi:hypothetical protein